MQLTLTLQVCVQIEDVRPKTEQNEPDSPFPKDRMGETPEERASEEVVSSLESLLPTSSEDTHEWKLASSAAHAAAKKRGLDHGALRTLLGLQSLKMAPASLLRKAYALLTSPSLQALLKAWEESLEPQEQEILGSLRDHLLGLMTLRLSHCKGCGKTIAWGITQQGKRTPIERPEYRSLSPNNGRCEKRYVLDPNYRLELRDTYPPSPKDRGILTYKPHHAGCSHVAQFRRKRG
ncbi:MAG: hypothetical protein H6727_09415 [Myxococcales bacterium]|nr:hypothetical protein [Myxococcales bacterium]